MTKTVLITGCSSGIGKTLALTLSTSGYRIYASARNPEKLADLAGKSGIHTIALDVTDENSIATAIDQIRQAGHPIDILINNAGYGAMGPTAEMPAQELQMQFQTNVFGPISLIRACVPLMISQGAGLVVNIGSVSGVLVTPFSGAYCATKAALHALSDALRMELAPFNIKVLTVQPGAIASEFGNSAEASLARTLGPESIYRDVHDGILKRARMSQQRPTSAQALVDELIPYLEQPNPPAVVRIGNGSTALPLMAKWLPKKLSDRLLKRSFGLS